MNLSFKYTSLSIVTLSFFVSMPTHCMLAKKLAKITISKKCYTTKKITSDDTTKTIQSTPSLGYYKDGFFSYWLSFRTIKEAAQALNHDNQHTQDSARRFFFERIKKKKNLATIACIAEQTFTAAEKTHHEWRPKESALHIFTALAECGHVPPTALKFATTGTITAGGYGNISWASRDLFNVLFQRNHPQAFDVAIETATQAFLHEDGRTRDNGIDLFKILFNHGKGFKEATTIALCMVNDESNWQKTSRDISHLLINLVDKNQGFEVATTIAMRLCTSKDHDVQMSSLWLLMNLVKKNQLVKEAMKVAQEKIDSDDRNVQDLAYKLRNLCLDKLPKEKPKKKRLLKDELRYSQGEPMGSDTLKWSISAAQFADMLPQFEEQHRDIDAIQKKLDGNRD